MRAVAVAAAGLAAFAGMMTAAKANVSAAPETRYVSAQTIGCSYALSADDLKAVDAAGGPAPRFGATVRVWVDESGKVSDAVVEKSSRNPAFDNAALQASRRAQCRPVMGSDGKPVAVETNFDFSAARPIVDARGTGQGTAAPLSGLPLAPSLMVGTTNSSLLATALPFDLRKPLDSDLLVRFGIDPGSSKAKLLADWARQVVEDPDIKRFFSSDNNPATAGQAALLRGMAMLDGIAKISPEDREQLTAMTTHAFDSAPEDCGGVKNVQLVTSRYMSLGTQSDAELQAQLQALFHLLKQSTQSTPPPELTPGQRLQGQLALSASIAAALKHDPSETEDLGVLLGGKVADLSPQVWCKATRFYRHAFDATPQPQRDWVMVAAIEDQRRSASIVTNALKNLAAMMAARQSAQQPASAPTVFDYAEMVRQHVRPNIVWSGEVKDQQTVIEVHCTSSGSLESARIVRSSGDRGWDKAALDAVRRSDPMPRDENGEAPRVFTITLRPGI
ncbi:cell envelope integrity protein TolA [Paraburkholderia sp. ZP32-5]|uniref:cell envelope integrity protein TolA n=1 Tax=Paraburkholderia sp. ZP32-5 TaxID=2883245 RepID=UPI001F23C32D|nr:cell envelope integrity protein TolA [Paraburkholderia sp. ZP32-5]